MWADNEADIDLLGFDYLVDTLYAAVTEPRLQPLTVGLFGDWGSGKSSVMTITRRKLEQFRKGDASESPYICVPLNPWQYEDYDDVKVGLMTTILDAIGDRIADDAPEQKKVSALRKCACSFRRRERRIGHGGAAVVSTAAPLIAQGLNPTIAPAVLDRIKACADTTATEGTKPFQDPKPVDSTPTGRDTEPITDAGRFRTEFEALVKDLADVEALVVFIDDLDRCLPETVVDTFESIRLLASTSKTAYVFAADQAVVEAAIDSRYPELVQDSAGLGATYLEKMLQLKVTIPQLSAPAANTYINLLLAELHLNQEQFSKVVAQARLRRATGNPQIAFDLGVCSDVLDEVPDDLVRDLTWASGVAELLGSRLRGNPRQLKRFLNNLMLKHRSANRRGMDLQLPVLAKLMALEEQYSTEFRQLLDWQLGAADAIPQLRLAEKAALASPAQRGPAPDGTERIAPVQARRMSSAAKQEAGSAHADTGNPAEQPELPDDVQAWTENPHIRAWLQLPPQLGDINLQPYLTYSSVASGPTEVSDSRIIAELNHALQTPLRSLGYALRNLENLPDDILIKERAKRLADMTAMLDNCTSALATFRGLADRVESVPERQPYLDDSVRALACGIQQPSDEPVAIDFIGLPDQVEGFSNHYLLTMLQPLVENAIEGCLPGGVVEITYTDHGDAIEFTVFNPVDHPVDKDILFAPRLTTKDGHQGLGVSIASRLAEFERGDLTADITNSGVRMRVVLPRR